MKTLSLIAVCCWLVVSVSAQEKKDFWENGQLKSVGTYNSQGAKIGAWKYYYDNGKPEATGSYAENPNASMGLAMAVKLPKNSAIGEEKAGSARNGEWLFYYDNGQLKDKVVYQNGCATGLVTRWHKTGQKSEETEYIDCKPNGSRKMWDKDGKLFFEMQVISSTESMEIEWYPTGAKKSEVPYKNGQQYGRVRRWYPSGQKEEEVMMKNTRVHGHYRSWYENGNKQREFFSISNVMSGEYREWAEDGTLIREYLEMTEEKKITVRTYWENGQLKMQGTSKMPESLSLHQWHQTRHGQWTYWSKEGEVLKTENYQDGKLISTEMP